MIVDYLHVFNNKFYLINSKRDKIFLNLSIAAKDFALNGFVERRQDSRVESYWLNGVECISTHEAVEFTEPCEDAPDERTKQVRLNFQYHYTTLKIKQLARKNKKHVYISLFEVRNRNEHVIVDGNYYVVVNFFDYSFGYSIGDTIELAEFCKFRVPSVSKHVPHEFLIAYDCETIFVGNRHVAYLLHVTLDYNLNMTNDQENYTFVDQSCLQTGKSSCSEQFFDWLCDLIKDFNDELSNHDYIIRLIGYNNFRFDNHILLDYLNTTDKLKKFNYYQSMRNNKVTTSHMIIGGFKIIFSDLVSWIPDKTLSEACEDYNVTNPKMNLNIVAYNELVLDRVEFVEVVDEKDLKPLLKDSSFGAMLALRKSVHYDKTKKCLYTWDYVMEYCKYDCLAVIDLFNILIDTFKSLQKSIQDKFEFELAHENCFNYISPSQFAGEIFKRTFKSQDELKMRILNDDYGRFIFASYFGGRTDFSFVGQYYGFENDKGECSIRYYDVTSEYPLAMNGLYPSVQDAENDVSFGYTILLEDLQKVIDNIYAARWQAYENKTLDDFRIYRPLDENFQGIFLCNVYQPDDITNLITWAPKATRKRGHNLCYAQCTQEKIVLNTAHIKAYLLCGFKVELVEHEYNTLFKRIAQPFHKMNKILGQIKTEARTDNKTKAKLIKLLQNSIPGKLAQRVEDCIDTCGLWDYYKPRNGDVYDESTSILTDRMRFNQTNWAGSHHYLATFIIQQANFILYSTFYKLSLEYVYNKVPHTKRIGSLIYCDTDSIVFDSHKCAPYNFNCSEEIGDWNRETNEFDITWKEKYHNQISSVVIFGKKSYMFMRKNGQCINIKLKGIHGGQTKQFTSQSAVDSILSLKKKEITFGGLERKRAHTEAFMAASSNFDTSPFYYIRNTTIRKTLSIASDFYELLEADFDSIAEKNKQSTLLKFTISKYD